jgi:hypothetical protein
MTKLSKILMVSLAPLLAVGCSSSGGGGDPSCTGAKCDDLDKPDSEIEDSPCDGLLVDHSGRGHDKVAGRLNDPVATKVFRAGDDCPVTFADIMAKLRVNDNQNCPDARSGITTRVVTETAQAMGTPTSYRLVTSRTCDGRPTHSVVFSLFGVTADPAALPPNVEIMAFDATTGVFNYYETDGRKINFFGNSKDMLKGKGSGEDRRCAECHTGGGMIMKELDTPWVHWEGHMNTPGAQELVSKFDDLGSKASGAELEGMVKRANADWNKVRLEFLKANGTPQDVLRPLFCDVELNLDNGADFESPVAGGPGGSEIRGLPFDSLLDPHLKGFGSIPINFEDYDAAIKANGQRLQGIPNAVDTVFDYVFIERAHADNNYVDALKAAGILDDELIKDVLMVDFTRPVFSDDRCGLLQFVPGIPNDELDPQRIRDGLIANLQSAGAAAGTPAGELLANLEATGGHDDKVNAFTAACTATDKKTMVENALKVTSLNRNLARRLPVFEFPQTMPIDDLNVAPGTRFDPRTCDLTTEFVSVATPAE